MWKIDDLYNPEPQRAADWKIKTHPEADNIKVKFDFLFSCGILVNKC